jgi:hypothetical protein
VGVGGVDWERYTTPKKVPEVALALRELRVKTLVR